MGSPVGTTEGNDFSSESVAKSSAVENGVPLNTSSIHTWLLMDSDCTYIPAAVNLSDNGCDISQLFTSSSKCYILSYSLFHKGKWMSLTGVLSALNLVLGTKAKECYGHLGSGRT